MVVGAMQNNSIQEESSSHYLKKKGPVLNGPVDDRPYKKISQSIPIWKKYIRSLNLSSSYKSSSNRSLLILRWF